MRQSLAFTLLLALGLSTPSPAKPPTESFPLAKAEATPAPDTATLPTPLPAELFTGRVREAYQVAADIPEILAGLSCHCGCARSLKHRHLLDCFVDDHGAG